MAGAAVGAGVVSASVKVGVSVGVVTGVTVGVGVTKGAGTDGGRATTTPAAHSPEPWVTPQPKTGGSGGKAKGVSASASSQGFCVRSAISSRRPDPLAKTKHR